jgi:hypothetical protein
MPLRKIAMFAAGHSAPHFRWREEITTPRLGTGEAVQPDIPRIDAGPRVNIGA